MKKYLPHIFILVIIILMIIGFIQGESYKYHISNLLFIIAMIITIFERNKNEKKK